MLKILYIVFALCIYNINLSQALIIDKLNLLERSGLNSNIGGVLDVNGSAIVKKSVLDINASASIKKSVTNLKASLCTEKETQCSQPSLGRQIQLGDGYNVIKDTPLVGVSPWSEESKKAHTNKKISNELRDIDYYEETSSAEREKKLELSASLALSVYAGTVSVSASGDYLNYHKSKSTNVRVVAKYVATTHFDTLTLPIAVDNQDFCNADHKDATHVITAIQYGTEVFNTFETEISSTEDSSSIATQLTVDVKDVFNASAGVKVNRSSNISEDRLTFRFFGNTNAAECGQASFEGVKKCFDFLAANANKVAQPIRFTITKIDRICSATDVIFSTLDSSIENEFAKILRSFGDIKVEFDTWKDSVVGEYTEVSYAIDTYLKNVSEFQKSYFGPNFVQLIIDYRSKEVDNTSALEAIIKAYEESYISVSKSDVFVNYLKRNIEAFNFFMTGVLFDGPHLDHYKKCTVSGTQDVYLFTINALPEGTPKNNVGQLFLEGKLDTDSDWIYDLDEVSKLFRDFKAGAKTNPGCYVVNIALKDSSTFPVTVKSYSRFGDVTISHKYQPIIPKPLGYNSCRWVNTNSFGSSVECAATEFATGACASGRYRDCPGNNVVALRCCPSDNLRWNSDCNHRKSGFGGEIVCDLSSHRMIKKTCSPGAYRDCSGTANTADCCTANNAKYGIQIGPRDSSDCDGWQWGTYGQKLQCSGSKVLIGRCGSGAYRDCPGTNSHGIYCCSVYNLQ